MLTNVIARINETAVFAVIPSPMYMYVKIPKQIAPIPKPINRPGHNNPSKCSTMYLVPNMYVYEITAPNMSANNIGFSANHFHLNWPLV